MLKRAAGVMLLVAALSANAFADSDFEFKGYLRAGAVYNQSMNIINTGLFEPDSGDVNKIGRLGVGENNFLEAELVKNFKAGKTWAKAHIMFAHSTTDTPTFSGSTAVRQAFVEMGGMPMSLNATFWVGKKFNGRDDIHILDKYWRVQSGTGLGVLNGNMDISLVTGANNGPADKDGGEVANATDESEIRFGSQAEVWF